MTVAEETVEGFKETEVGLLPKDWEVVRLESQLELIKNGITKTQNKESLGYPITRIETIADERIDMLKTGYVTNLNDSEIQRYKLEIEDILFSHINSEPHLGKTAIYKGIPPVLIHGMNLLMLRANKTTMNAYYFNYLCNFYRGKGVFVGLAARAVGQSSINQGKLKALEIPLPPLPEQQKIVSVLSAIQEAKEKTENVIQATKELKKSMMKHLFTYGPVPLEDAEKVPLKETEIGMIPEHWEVKKLGDIATQRKESVTPLDDGKSKYIGLEHIDSGYSRLQRYGVENEVKSSKFKFYKDDILYGKLRPYLNKCILSDFEGICSTDIIAIKSSDHIDCKYLVNMMHLRSFIDYATSTMTGVNHPRTSWKALNAYKFSLPPLPEQKQIAQILSAIDKKIEAEEAKRNTLNRVCL